MRLATSSNRALDEPSQERLETFVAEIQLYGTPRQIQLMTQIVEAFRKPNNFRPPDIPLQRSAENHPCLKPGCAPKPVRFFES